MAAAVGRQLLLRATNSYGKNLLQAALSGGGLVAADGVVAALASQGLFPVFSAAASASGRLVTAMSDARCGLPAFSASPAAGDVGGSGGPGSAALGLLPASSGARGVLAGISASLAAGDVAGSWGPGLSAALGVLPASCATAGRRPLSGSSTPYCLVLVGLAGATFISEDGDQYVLFEKKFDEETLKWQEELARREGRMQELLEGLLEDLKTRGEALAQREKRLDDASDKKQARFDEERKGVDNSKRLLDEDRRKLHQERGAGRDGNKDGKEEDKSSKIIWFPRTTDELLQRKMQVPVLFGLLFMLGHVGNQMINKPVHNVKVAILMVKIKYKPEIQEIDCLYREADSQVTEEEEKAAAAKKKKADEAAAAKKK